MRAYIIMELLTLFTVIILILIVKNVANFKMNVYLTSLAFIYLGMNIFLTGITYGALDILAVGATETYATFLLFTFGSVINMYGTLTLQEDTRR